MNPRTFAICTRNAGYDASLELRKPLTRDAALAHLHNRRAEIELLS